jgi:hypothetical protein
VSNRYGIQSGSVKLLSGWPARSNLYSVEAGAKRNAAQGSYSEGRRRASDGRVSVELASVTKIFITYGELPRPVSSQPERTPSIPVPWRGWRWGSVTRLGRRPPPQEPPVVDATAYRACLAAERVVDREARARGIGRGAEDFTERLDLIGDVYKRLTERRLARACRPVMIRAPRPRGRARRVQRSRRAAVRRASADSGGDPEPPRPGGGVAVGFWLLLACLLRFGPCLRRLGFRLLSVSRVGYASRCRVEVAADDAGHAVRLWRLLEAQRGVSHLRDPRLFETGSARGRSCGSASSVQQVQLIVKLGLHGKSVPTRPRARGPPTALPTPGLPEVRVRVTWVGMPTFEFRSTAWPKTRRRRPNEQTGR